MEELKKAFEVASEWYHKVCAETRDTATAYLKAILESKGGKIDNQGRLLDGIAVAYDGGNHPEYASCIDSVVIAIYIDGDTIMFELEDECVDIDRITTCDLEYVVSTINSELIWEKMKKEENSTT